ncbi:MAG: hypothetical protein M0Z75_14375 [Nitrospiraceae bacterium]|nr:hypothetical protein [Nitrospiraceae bacterium]
MRSNFLIAFLILVFVLLSTAFAAAQDIPGLKGLGAEPMHEKEMSCLRGGAYYVDFSVGPADMQTNGNVSGAYVENMNNNQGVYVIVQVPGSNNQVAVNLVLNINIYQVPDPSSLAALSARLR